MNTAHYKIVAAMSLCAAAVPGLSFGALIDRGGGLIYDTELNITWMADANYAQTSGYDSDGVMTWPNGMTWAANLTYYDSVRGVNYDDWRLPTTWQPDLSCSSNCTDSEMGHLFYNELGGVAGESILTTHNSNYDLFTNIQPYWYWSSTEAPNPAGAWYFGFNFGSQYYIDKITSHNVWAVRDGDVVPVPAAAWLFGSGLLGLLAVTRRSSQRA